MNALAIVVGLTAAVAFGASTALMHHSASRAPKAAGIVALLRHLSVQPRWLAGMGASLAGVGLHAVALRLGTLAVIQPLVVTSLVFAFVFRAALDRRRPSKQLMAWVLLTAAGIALFLVGASSTSEPMRELSGTMAAVFLALGTTVAFAAWFISRLVVPYRSGLLLGVSGGIVFGLIAGVLKIVTSSADLLAALTSWPIFALAALGATGFLINQRAYSSAPLASSLPVLNVVNPVVAVIFGVVVFHERPSSEPVMILLELTGLVLVLVGVSSLARVEEHPGASHRPPPSPIAGSGGFTPAQGRVPAQFPEPPGERTGPVGAEPPQ